MALYDPPVRFNPVNLDLDAAAKNLPINREQVENLYKLALFLRDLPPEYDKFNMYQFIDIPRSSPTDEPLHYACNVEEINVCGTAACAVGHGPSIGISHFPKESWNRYSARVFGVCLHDNRPKIHSMFEFMFAGDWVTEDNTPQGAAARIFYTLDNNPIPDFSEPSIDEDHWNTQRYASYL